MPDSSHRPKLPLLLRCMGRMGYREALALQEELVARRRRGEVPDTLLLLEHPPLLTLGRAGDPRNVLVGRAELARRGIEFHETGRGGDVTYHGPGQLVGYPLLALPRSRRDAHRYLRDLEEALIRAVASFGIDAGRLPGLTGVWAGGAKLAAIGVRLHTGWITSHGFALNVTTDLSGFETIVPCGIAERGVTSLERLLGRVIDLEEVAARVGLEIARVFDLEPRLPPVPAERPALEQRAAREAAL